MLQVGGAPHDPALEEVVTYFTAARLPREVLTGGGGNSSSSNAVAAGGSTPSSSPSPATSGLSVRKGSTISFSRRAGGTLVASAGGCVLGQVVSPKVCEALFDLYLGDMPVSKKAKVSAFGAAACMCCMFHCTW